jgi:hypothetical protein
LPSHFEGRRVAEGGRARQVFRAREVTEGKKERQHKTSHTWERGGKKRKKEKKRKRRRAALFKECRPSHFREKEKE